MNPPSLQFYQSIFMMIISMILMIQNKKPFAPRDLTPYLVRGTLEGLVYVFFYFAVPITPLAMFSVLFNSRSVIIFLIEGLYVRKCPRAFHLVLSFVSFIGVVILLGPSIVLPASSGHSKILFVYGSLLTLVVAVMTSSVNIYTKYNGESLILGC